MSVRIEDEVIYLAGRCLAEDAEALLVALQEGPIRTVDLVVNEMVRGIPEQEFAAHHLVNLLQ
jgi:hypothetical protein